MRRKIFGLIVALTASLLLLGCQNPTAPTPDTGGTSLSMTLTGDDSSLFKLSLDSYGITTSSAIVQSSPAIWNVDFTEDSKDVIVNAFIDADNDNELDQTELRTGSRFTLTKNITNTYSITIGKSVINVTVSGNPAIFTHPMLVHNGTQSGSSSKVVASFQSGAIVTYGNLTGAYGASGNLSAFDDLNNNNLYDYNEPTISTETVFWEYAPTKDVAITLRVTAPQILPDGEKIEMGIGANTYYPEDLLHYRFVFDTNRNKIIFVIPVGAGTDGAFITCYQCETNPPRSDWHSGDHLWKLFTLVYAGNLEMRSSVMTNYSQQLVEFKQNIKDAVTYLETVKGFTVYGKETLPSNW